MKRVYDITIKLCSALHINGGTNADGVRTAIKSNEKAYIPATLFKGMVRENFEKLVTLLATDERFIHLGEEKCTGKKNAEEPCSCPTCTMFGKAGFQLSRIYFDNLETKQELTYLLRTNVAIDRYLGKAKEGALCYTQTVDANDKSGNPVVFSGQVTVWLPENYGEEILVCLTSAMKMIKTMGLGKSRGLGFVEVNVCEAEG